jgi:hypothetical protein
MLAPAIWSCQVGEIARGLLPRGSDLRMREAVETAYESVVGFPADFVFSGWDDALREGKRAFLDQRPPDTARLEAEAIDRLRCLPSWSALRQAAEREGWI